MAPGRTLAGFSLTLGITLGWLGLIVLLPLLALLIKAAGLGPQGWWDIATDPRVLAAMRLSFGTALIDLPFALPTAVAGIVMALMFVGLPFTVRTVQPVLENLAAEHEEAAASLGASRLLWAQICSTSIWHNCIYKQCLIGYLYPALSSIMSAWLKSLESAGRVQSVTALCATLGKQLFEFLR